jgi:copper chaperone
MVTQQYYVPGVSCAHCVRAVTEEIGTLSDVMRVDVNLDSKIVTVDHGDSVTSEQIVAAIQEAGYDQVTVVR